jgi:hypothetical protein
MSKAKQHFYKVMELIKDLEVNWDDEGAEPMREEVIGMTKDVFEALMDAWHGHMDIVNVSPLSDGSIDLYWATRISKKAPWCGENLKSQLLLNISYCDGDYRISCNGTMDAWDKKADTVSFVGDNAFFMRYDLASLQRFHTN